MFSFLRDSCLRKNLIILFITHFLVDFFNGIWPIYKTICGIDIAKAGLIAGISGFLGESLQLLFGYFSDKGKRKQILVFGLLIGSSIVWITFAKGFFIYFLLLLFLNIGSGSFHPAAVGYVGALTREHKAKTILLFASGGLLGLASSQMIFTTILSFCGGHCALLSLPVLAIAFWLRNHKFPEMIYSSGVGLKEVIDRFSGTKKTLTLLYFSQLFSYGLVLALIFLLPDVLKAKTSDHWLKMGGGHFCFIFGGALALPPIGYLCDRYGQKTIILSALTIGACLLYLLAFTPRIDPISGSLILLLLGASLHSINPTIVSWGHKVAPHSPSIVSGLLMGFAWCFSHMGPLIAGALYKNFSINPEIYTLLYLGILLAASFIVTLLIPVQEPTLETL